MKWTCLFFLVFSVMCYCACSTSTELTYTPTLQHEGTDSLMRKIESLQSKLQDGDLVLRLGNDITSNMLSQLNLVDKRFSHIGICFVENGQKLVYHSIGGEGEIEGNYLRKVPVEAFFDPTNNIAFGIAKTTFSQEEKVLLNHILEEWQKQKIPFDMSFDLKTDDSLYCSEMVAKAIHRSNEKIAISSTDTLGYNYFSIDNITKASFVDTIYYYSRKRP